VVTGRRTATATATPAHLLSLIVRHLHTSSNLHEELHHSFFLYLLMGHRHFVGLPEYASCLLCCVLPLLLLFLAMYDQARGLFFCTAPPLSAQDRSDPSSDEHTGDHTDDDHTDGQTNNRTDDHTDDNTDINTASGLIAEASKHTLSAPVSREALEGRLALLRRGACALSLDALSGTVACVIGYMLLCEWAAQRCEGASCPVAVAESWSSVVTTIIMPVYLLYQSMAPAALQFQQGQTKDVGMAELWYFFTSMCCVAYTWVLLGWYCVASSDVGDKEQRERLSSGDSSGLRREEKMDRTSAWLKGYGVAFFLLLSCVMSVLSMYHSVLAFALVIPLVPVIFMYFVAFFDPNACNAGRKHGLGGFLHQGKCGFFIALGACLSPAVLVCLVVRLKGAMIPVDAPVAAGSCVAMHAEFFLILFRLLSAFVEEVRGLFCLA
jgi:hypothetical protein